jgi:hypothetical protein
MKKVSDSEKEIKKYKLKNKSLKKRCFKRFLIFFFIIELISSIVISSIFCYIYFSNYKNKIININELILKNQDFNSDNYKSISICFINKDLNLPPVCFNYQKLDNLPDSTTISPTITTLLPNKISNLKEKKILSISLRKQNRCTTNQKKQCWDGLLIENENVFPVEIPVFFIMNGCKAFKENCPRQTEDDAVCFKRTCNKTSSFILINKNNNPNWTNPNEVYFENYEGNYHSSWQHDLSNQLKNKQYEAMEQTQEIIKTLNIYSKFSINELYLTFTIVNSCNDCKSSSRKELQYIEKTSHVVKSKIEINTNHFYLGIFLHERLHENINSNTTNLFLINRDSEKLPPVYIGDRTVKLVMNDYNQKKIIILICLLI